MKKFVFKFLIFCFSIFLVLIFLSCLILKKDLGYDDIKAISKTKLISDFKTIQKDENVTIDGVDYLMTNVDIGRFGGNLTVSIMGEPKTFNPYNANDATSAELSEIMYDGLVKTDPSTGEVVPKLAKSIDILPDKLTYIVNLRHGVKWSDGVEITADDVLFTYNTIIKGGYGDGSARDTMLIRGKLPEVRKIDKYKVEFITPEPFAPFLRNLSASIVPEHIFKTATKKGKDYFLTYQGIDVDPKSLVVSGAFKLSEYTPSQRVVFERNPNYYLINKHKEKLPYLDKWINVIVGDMNNDTLKFESNVTDILTVNPALLDRYKELSKEKKFKLYNLGTSTNTTFISLNLNNRKNKEGKFYVEPKKQLWFQDLNFRSALDWAIDRDDLILNIFHGLASPLYTAESLKSLYLSESLAKGHKKDLDYAYKLLQKSGFYKKDGVLYDKFGNMVEFELLTNAGNTQREAAGVSIKEDFEQLGIKVNFKAVEFNSLVNKIVNEVNYDCIIIALTSNILEPNSGYNVWYHLGALHMFNKRTPNDLEKSDRVLDFERELDDLFTQGALELDFEKRKEIYNKYQETIARENPFIYLYAPLTIYAVRDKIKNILPTKFGGLYPSLAEIYVEE